MLCSCRGGTRLQGVRIVKDIAPTSRHSHGRRLRVTLLGVGAANVIYLPVAARLRALSGEEVELRNLTIEGILSVQAGDNPRVVGEKLTSYLPPDERPEEEYGKVTQMPQREAA